MARKEPNCQVCRSPDRAAIELARANGTSCRILGSRYDIHMDAIWRHSTNHMSKELKARLKAAAFDPEVDLDAIRIEESESLLSHLRAIRARLYRGIDNAETFGNLSDLAKMSGQIHKNIELTGKLVGDLRTGTVNNMLILAPEYHQLRTGLVLALKPYPKARLAVTQLLQTLEADTTAIEHKP